MFLSIPIVLHHGLAHNAISMFGLNWVDLLIVALLAGAAWRGVKTGLMIQLFGLIGFFAVFVAGSWLLPRLLPIGDETMRTMLSVLLATLIALYAGLRASMTGHRIHWSFHVGKLQNNHNFRRAETAFGALPPVLALLTLIWLLGVAVSRLPFEEFSNSFSNSAIVRGLTDNMPPVPAVFAFLDRQVDPNAPPYVPVEPRLHADFDYSKADFATAADKSRASVVRVTSFGCGGIVSGSGFVVADNLIATNAHVIAGVKRPIIKYRNQSYAAVPVLFNPALDLALMRTDKLKAPALPLISGEAALDSTVAIVGYPGGDYFEAPGILRDTLAVSTVSIYNQGSFGRGVYAIQARVENGSSGSPVTLKNGQAAGIIFSKSTEQDDTAYALTADHILDALTKTQSSTRRVSTGACTK